MPKAEAKELTRTQAGDALALKQTKTLMERTIKRAERVVFGLFRKPEEEGYNTDADVPFTEASTKTKVALELVKMSRGQGDGETRVLGVIFMQGRTTDPKTWEAEARRIDDEEKRRNAVDVPVDE